LEEQLLPKDLVLNKVLDYYVHALLMLYLMKLLVKRDQEELLGQLYASLEENEHLVTRVVLSDQRILAEHSLVVRLHDQR